MVPEASNVFFEVMDSEPRIAVAIGEKYFLRAGNSLAATTLVMEIDEGTLVKVIASGGRESFLIPFDWGSSKDYARSILDALSNGLRADYRVVSEVDYLEQEKSEALRFGKK